MSSRFRREQLTVGREAILLDTLDHLRSAIDRKSKHHFLFLGPRGIGKSHLLAVIEDRIAADPRLAKRIVVARFPEESVRTLSFADLLKQLVSILATNLTDEPQWKDLSARIAQVQDSSEVVDSVVPALRRTNEAMKRTIVVMIENLNELFSKQIRQDQQIGAIRKFFMDKNGCLLVATAPMHFDAVTDVAQPFYDFFDTQTLQPFDKEQSITLLDRTRAIDGSNTNTVKDLSHCVMALHDMTGGNPRLMVMTCELIVREGIESAREILLRLVDRISPIYQASLAEMAPQERALLETLASMRDATPRTPANIALKLGLSERQTSALLKRLADARLVTFAVNPDDKRSRSYCIRDGFFDVWLTFQVGGESKRRIASVADFLQSFYRQNLGPYQKADDNHLRVEVNNSCEPKSDSTYSQDANQFLKLAEEQIKAWSGNRSGLLESLSSDVMLIWKIASNRAIGEWYARKFSGISDPIISKPADPKADLRTISSPSKAKNKIPSELQSNAVYSTHATWPLENVKIRFFELSADDVPISTADLNLDIDQGKFDSESSIGASLFRLAKDFQGADIRKESTISQSTSTATQLVADQASQICDEISERLEESSLAWNSIQNAIEYQRGQEWLGSGALRAHPKQRRKLLVRLANALLLDLDDKRIPNQGLDDALNLLDLADKESIHDAELDALTIATRLIVDHIRGDDSKSLDDLKEIDHPVAFASRIRLLFLRAQIEEAFELVHHRELNARWAGIAAAIYVRHGRLSDAIGICESMRNGNIKGSDNPNLVTIRYFGCLMLVADEYLRQKFSEGRTRVDLVTDAERKQLTEIRNILSPIVTKVFGAGRVSNGIELRSLEIAFNAAHMTEDNELASRIAMLLASANPISRRVSRPIHAGFLKADVDIVSRLKKDWPNSVEVSLSICELITFYLDDPVAALTEVESLLKAELNLDQKSRLASVLLALYKLEPGELRNKSFSLLAEVAGADHYFLRMAEAISATDRGDLHDAERLLNERPAPDDPDWLSLLATVLQRKGELKPALSHLKKLCEITSAPDVLRRAVTLALKIEPKDLEFAISILERLSRFPNERKSAERILAEIFWESGTDDGLFRAAQLYKKLYEESPKEPELAKNAAICLRNLNEIDQAIALLEDLERDHPEFIEGFLLHADLLETQARSEDAFALLDLESVRNRFWNKLEFLHKYMHLGYLTAHELAAHKAMCQISVIEDGKPEQEKTLQAKNLEQIVDFFRGRRQFFEQIEEMAVRGQAPWTMHAFQTHTPILLAWTYRTQKLIPWETLSGRASFCTYASNAFFSKLAKPDERQLEPIEPGIAGCEVVADISALITLYKLGLLEKAAEYFGTIYLPSAYREIEQFDAKRLQPHQLSRIEQSHRLFAMMVRGQLRRPSNEAGEVEVIDFQTEADPTSYSVGDVALWLKRRGHISNHRYKQLAVGQSFMASGREGIESILISNRCQFTLFALQTLESAGLLESLMEQCRVTLTEAAARELEQEQFAFEQQTKTARESRDLWRIIRDNNRFQYYGLVRKTASNNSESEAKEEFDDSFSLSLVSYELAKERRLPILADDRVLLTIAQNESDGRDCVAFSTLELLSSLGNGDSLSLDERLQHSLQLINWRYRFLRIDHQLLLHAAKLTVESGQMPGFQLKRIAKYIQDCMLDAGLFGGDENVTPRVSMALELFSYWTRTVARFINELWNDDSFNDELAESLTRWAIDSLLPTTPVCVLPDLQIRMSENQAKLVLIHLLSARGANPNTTRSAKLMSVLEDTLRLSPSELYGTVFQLIETDDDGEGTALLNEKWSATQQAFRRSIAKHALSPFCRDGNYQLDARGAALLEASKSLRKNPGEQGIPEHILKVLKNFEDENAIKTAPPGPLVFHRLPEEGGATVFEGSDLLIYPNSKAREAVVSYLSQTATRSEGCMSERLKKAVSDHSKKIAQKRAVNWYPAAEHLMELIENDWQFNLAGFRQVLITKNQDLIYRFWNRCVRPQLHPAYALPTSSFHACTDRKAMKDRVLPCITQEAIKNGIAESYLNHLGHLPLVDEWSLIDVAKQAAFNLDTDELFQLAENDNYLCAYHGCAALVKQWAKLNHSQQTRTAKQLSDFICLSRSTDLSTRRGRFWNCMNRLADHFLAWIPLYGPELGDDNSASLAWWMAGRLAKVVCDDIEQAENPESKIQFVLERNLEPLVHFSFEINQLIRGGASRSVYHANTSMIQHGGPFFASLIGSFRLEFGSIYPLLTERARNRVDQWIFVNTVHQSVGAPQRGSLLFGNYILDIQTTYEQWEQVLNPNDETLAVLSRLRSDFEKVTNSNSLRDLLSAFDTLNAFDQSLWLNRMKSAVWLEAIPLDPILNLLRDPVLSRVFAQSMKIEQLSLAIELMLAIQQFGGCVWKQELPHRLVDWLDFFDTVEEKAIIFNGIICSSIVGEAPSAIDRVCEREDSAQLKSSFAFQEGRLVAARTIAPRWTWSKLRVYLERLRFD
jgi:hypothetical protein